MAVNVLVIPEDFRKDQYVLKPIIEKMFAALGVRARVQICRDPLLGGVGEAMKRERIAEIIARYRGMTRVFLLIVDRDCDDTRRAKLDGIEAHAAGLLEGSQSVFIAEAAWQEIEVWVLAGIDHRPKRRVIRSEWLWPNIRAHCDPKETYYEVVARDRGVQSAPYGGRIELATEAASNYARIRQLCPEDVGRLEQRVGAALKIAT